MFTIFCKGKSAKTRSKGLTAKRNLAKTPKKVP